MSEKNATAPAKATSRVALIKLSTEETDILKECFKPFNIQAIPLDEDAIARISTEKFEGCVVRLDDDAEPVLKAARNSKSNRGILIYGIATDAKAAMRFSPFGVNAVLNQPLERAATLKAVRATYLLALHEFRRYVRVPIAIQVVIQAKGRSVATLSQEVSSGGMSLESIDLLQGVETVEASFRLPDAQAVTMKSQICWRRDASKCLGIKFDVGDPKRSVVRGWIDQYLDQVG